MWFEDGILIAKIVKEYWTSITKNKWDSFNDKQQIDFIEFFRKRCLVKNDN
jgi:hypothetical protein